MRGSRWFNLQRKINQNCPERKLKGPRIAFRNGHFIFVATLARSRTSCRSGRRVPYNDQSVENVDLWLGLHPRLIGSRGLMPRKQGACPARLKQSCQRLVMVGLFQHMDFLQKFHVWLIGSDKDPRGRSLAAKAPLAAATFGPCVAPL